MSGDPAVMAMHDAANDLTRVDGQFKLRRRPFPEAVRRALGLPVDTPDGEIIAEIVLLRLSAGGLPESR